MPSKKAARRQSRWLRIADGFAVQRRATQKTHGDCLAQALLKTQARVNAMTNEAKTEAKPRAAADVVERQSAITPDEMARLTDEIVGALKTVYDPEIPADIYELGLIYKVDIDDDRMVNIEMTLTTPNCPSAEELPHQIENAVAGVRGVREAKVNIVWDPPWDPSRMSDEARTVLNMW
jgi:FeS assembly SUF system protein